MYKKIFNFTFFIFIIFIFYVSFKKYILLSTSLKDTSIMFINNVFPFLFITILLNNLLFDLNLPMYFRKVFQNNYIYIFFISILSGAPTSAIIIEKHLKDKVITGKDASILLSFTTFNSPLFLYSYLNTIFIDIHIVLKIIAIIYLSNIGLLLFYKNKLSNNNIVKNYKQVSIINSLTSSIKCTINSILYIFSTILFFKMVSDLLIPESSIIRGFIEVTQGLQALSKISLPLKIKELLSLVILNFAGLSIHIQICNVLKDYNINYKYFYISRIIYSLISLIVLII